MLGGQTVLQHRPVAWQTAGGMRVPVNVEYLVDPARRQASLKIAQYDHSQALVIDPVLQYGTYFGGTGNEGANSLAVDSAGNTYITGATTSSNLPASPTAPYQSALRGPSDAFVTKMNATGTALVYTTYLGGSGDDQGKAIAVDSSGNAYICGVTSSTNFPSAGGGVSQYYGGTHDGFAAVLNANGNALTYASYLGGAGDDTANALTLDSGANMFIAGSTSSARFTGIGTTASTVQPANGGGYDAFIIKLSKTGTIFFSSFFGGTGDEFAHGIAIDSGGSAYVVGSSTSPALPRSSSRHRGSQRDVFLINVFFLDGGSIAAFDLGGSSDQSAYGVAVDPNRQCFITGTTNSTDFPVTASAPQVLKGVGYDAFVTQLNPTGAVVASEYLGGSGSDVGYGIGLDFNGNIYVGGYTDSPDFLPGLPNHPGSGPHTFVAELVPSAGFAFAAYLGASDVNNPVSLALHATTTPARFPNCQLCNRPNIVPGNASEALTLFNFAGGVSDAFVAKLGNAGLSIVQTLIGPYIGSSIPGAGNILPGADFLILFAVQNAGPDAATNIEVQVQLPKGVSFLRCLPPTICTALGSTVTIVLPTLAAGATTPQIEILAAPSAALTSFSINLSIFSETNDPNVLNHFKTLSAGIFGVDSFKLSTLDLNFGNDVPAHGPGIADVDNNSR